MLEAEEEDAVVMVYRKRDKAGEVDAGYWLPQPPKSNE